MTRVLVHGPSDRIDRRYPPRIWVDDDFVSVERASEVADDAAAAIVDGDTAAAVAYINRNQPLLLGPETVRDLLTDEPKLLEHAEEWTCWLPHGLAAETDLARSLIAEGSIGSVTSGDLVTLVGTGVTAGATWESDSAVSFSRFEAVVTALDLLRCIGLAVSASWATSSVDDGGADVIQHQLSAGGVIRQRIEAADLYAVPAFSAEIRGTEGRLLLRNELAPGAVTVWDRNTGMFRAPALPKIKPNIQAPDTQLGGPETARQVAGVVAGDGNVTVLRSTALDLIARAIRLDPIPEGHNVHR